MINREAFENEAWVDMRKRLIELGRLDLPLPLAVVEEVPALFFSHLFPIQAYVVNASDAFIGKGEYGVTYLLAD